MAQGPGRNLIEMFSYCDGAVYQAGGPNGQCNWSNTWVQASPLQYICEINAVASFVRNGVVYTFKEWQLSGVVPDGLSSGTIRNQQSSIYEPGTQYLVAHAMYISGGSPSPTENYYSVTTASNPTGGGSTSGDGTYAVGNAATLTATPNYGYTFLRWESSEGATNYSQSFSYYGSSESSVLWTAYFSGGCTVTLNKFNQFLGNKFTLSQSKSDGKYVSGELCTITATLSNMSSRATSVWWGWTTTNPLDRLTEPTKLSDQMSYTFTVTSNITIWAIAFIDILFNVRTYKATRTGSSTATLSLDSSIPQPPISIRDSQYTYYFYYPNIISYQQSSTGGIWDLVIRICYDGRSEDNVLIQMNTQGSCGKNYCFLSAAKHLFYSSYYINYDTYDDTKLFSYDYDPLNNRDSNGNFTTQSDASEYAWSDGFWFYIGAMTQYDLVQANLYIDFYFSGPPIVTEIMKSDNSSVLSSLVSLESGAQFEGIGPDDPYSPEEYPVYDISSSVAKMDSSLDKVSDYLYSRQIPASAFCIPDDSYGDSKFYCNNVPSDIRCGVTYYDDNGTISGKLSFEKTSNRFRKRGSNAVSSRSDFSSGVCKLIFTFATWLIIYSTSNNQIMYNSNGIMYDG